MREMAWNSNLVRSHQVLSHAVNEMNQLANGLRMLADMIGRGEISAPPYDPALEPWHAMAKLDSVIESLQEVLTADASISSPVGTSTTVTEETADASAETA